MSREFALKQAEEQIDLLRKSIAQLEAENAALKRENEGLLLALFSLYQEVHGLGTLIQVELADVLFETRTVIGYERLASLLTAEEEE